MQSLRTLLSGIVDYAGLFPPASLDMRAAVETHARDRQGPQRWMLGSFVCPARRLGELEEAVADVLESTDDLERADVQECADGAERRREPWKLTVLLGPGWVEDLRRIESFVANSVNHPGPDRFEIVALEFKPPEMEDVAKLREMAGARSQLFCELPPLDALDEHEPWLATLRHGGVAAKLRTGGVEAHLVPDVGAVARFLSRCAGAGVDFKATAGLHHPLRAVHPLSYAPDSPRALMHGFLNLFVAAALLAEGLLDLSELPALLEERSIDRFRFGPTSLEWEGHSLNLDQIARGRRFARSFGSCSFAEPVHDLQRAELL